MDQASAEIIAAEELARAQASYFVVSKARAPHEQGMPGHDLESLVGRVAARLALDAQMLSLPPACLHAFTGQVPSLRVRSVIRWFHPGRMALTRRSQHIPVGQRVADDTTTVCAALARMTETDREPGPAWWVLPVVGMLPSAVATRPFGYRLGEVLLGSPVRDVLFWVGTAYPMIIVAVASLTGLLLVPTCGENQRGVGGPCRARVKS